MASGNTEKEIIKTEIANMIQNDDFGFEVFVTLKTEEKYLKRMLFYEDDQESSFKRKIQNIIVDSMRDKFLSETADYITAARIADNQKNFYVIHQSEDYCPFCFLKIQEEEITALEQEDCCAAEGIYFRFRRRDKVIWAYQHIIPSSIPNKKKQNIVARWLSTEKEAYFVEMTDQLFTITPKINLLIIEDRIVTDDIGLMQRHFKFETFIRDSADKAVQSIKQVDLVDNSEKLADYIKRSKLRYARRMMRINEYHVVQKDSEFLINKIQTVDRWKNVFEIVEGKICLNTFKDVENLIDFFNERYTVSEITGDEFDTDVKRLAKPVNNDG